MGGVVKRRGGAAVIGERGMHERVGGMLQYVGLLPAIWRRLWRPALRNEAGPMVSATIHRISFNEDGIELRMSAEAWLDHSDGFGAAGVCDGNRTDTGYQLLCASLGRCIPLPPVQPCPRAPIAAFSPKRSPGSRRSLQGVATRVIVDISERKGEGAGGRGAGAWQKKRRARARMQVTRETRDGAHKFEHLPRRVLLPPILCVSGNARNGQRLCFPGTNKGGVSHIAPAHVVDGPLVELVAVRRAAQEALGPGVLMPVRRQLRLAQLRKHGTPPPSRFFRLGGRYFSKVEWKVRPPR